MKIEEFRQLPKAEKRRLVGETLNHYVYRCYDAEGVLLYIGCTWSVANRIKAHQRAQGNAKASLWLSLCMESHTVEGPYDGRSAGRVAEAQAIRTEQPVFNIQGRGGGAFRQLNNIARYLIEHGHDDLALETACTCWNAEDLAEMGDEFSPWCVAHGADKDWLDDAVLHSPRVRNTAQRRRSA